MRALDQIRSLNHLPRTGWVIRDIQDPETVGEHTVECMAIAASLADELGVNRERLLQILCVHDWPESDPDVGDISPRCNIPPQKKQQLEHDAMVSLCATLPQGDFFFALWREYEDERTVESQVAHQIDVLQRTFKAVVYHVEQGLDPHEFLEEAVKKVQHPVLRSVLDRLNEAVLLP